MPMDPLVILAKLETPEECEQFAINVAQKYPEVALKAKRREVELRAKGKGARNDLERELLEAVFAYEAVLAQRRGKKIRATRTWQMIERHGIVEAATRAVDRPDDTLGYQALAAMGMQDISFEAVVIRHPSAFSKAAVGRCRERIAQFQLPIVNELVKEKRDRINETC